MEDLKKKFGKKVKYYRELRGFSQEKLGELTDTTRDTIRNIETGRNGPRFRLLSDLCRVLGVKPRDLFDF